MPLVRGALPMHIFSSRVFLETAGALFYPTRQRSIQAYELEGRFLSLLALDGQQPVRSMPFYDFAPEVGSSHEKPARPLRYFPKAVLRTVRLAHERVAEPAGFQPSPYIDWSLFTDWAAYEAFMLARPAAKANDSTRQLRRIERDLGPVSFVFDDQRPEAFDACVKWKSKQYVSTGVGDMFADPRNVELFRALQHKKAMVVSTFSAGPTLLAVHFGALCEGQLSWWVPAYDPAYSKYSPGRLLLESLIRESHRLGHREFDFLIGDEGYKFKYATHNRIIGPVGAAPLREQALALAKKEVKAVLAKFPQAYELARKLKRAARL